MIPPGETAPPLAQAAQLTGTDRHQPQYPVGLHPPQGEKKRPGRGLIGPVQVVDHHRDDPVAGLQVAQHCHQLRTDGHRVGVFAPRRPGLRGSSGSRRPGTGQELVRESPVQEHLRLVAAGPQHAHIAVLGDEARRQLDLPIPASPSTSTTRGRPARTACNSASRTASSSVRPTKWSTSAVWTTSGGSRQGRRPSRMGPAAPRFPPPRAPASGRGEQITHDHRDDRCRTRP